MATTALLKSAAATRKKIQAQEDALVSFEWENSAQTYDDFLTYSKYLQDRADSSATPSDALSYQTKQRAARRSYTSNELQRQQIDIMEGNATTQNKMDAVRELHRQAVENGDYNLAQNLYSQYDALSIKLQNEQEAAMKQYESTLRSGQKAADKAVTDLIKSLEKGVDNVTLPNGQTVTPLAAIAQKFQDTGDSVASLRTAQETLEALRGIIIDQYQNASTQEKVDELEQKYGAGLQNIDETLNLKVGGQTLNLQDVTNGIANEQNNNPLYGLGTSYNEATGRNEFQLKKNNVDSFDYVRKIDENGNEYFDAIEGTDLAKGTAIRTDKDKLYFGTSDQERGLKTQITNEGAVIGGGRDTGQINMGQQTVNRDESQTIENRLKNLGIDVKTNGTTLVIKLPGENVQRQATIQPDGSIRFFDDNGQLQEFGLIDRNLGTDMQPQVFRAGEIRPVSIEEVSDFGKASAFGGKVSQNSAQGNRYISSITGQSRATQLLDARTPIRVGNDFTGYGGPAISSAFQGGTSNLLFGANFTQRAIQQEQQRQAMLKAQEQAIQATSNQFDLNQTPVRQLTSSGILKPQLQVAAPTPTPRLYVAPPPTGGRVQAPVSGNTAGGGQYGAIPTGRISSVGVAGPQPRLVVR